LALGAYLTAVVIWRVCAILIHTPKKMGFWFQQVVVRTKILRAPTVGNAAFTIIILTIIAAVVMCAQPKLGTASVRKVAGALMREASGQLPAAFAMVSFSGTRVFFAASNICFGDVLIFLSAVQRITCSIPRTTRFKAS